MAIHQTIEPEPIHAPIRIGVIVSRYNPEVTESLREAAVESFATRPGADPEDELVVMPAPGAYEVPAIAYAAIETESFDGLVALACVIKGETRHDEVIAGAVVQGLTSLTVEFGMPIGLGVLTVDSLEQARARAGGEHGNKGAEAMNAVLGVLATVVAMEPSEAAEAE
ncbi:MAG: 6,7-dimethyl-8-ribityllumazine synthase [Planctomycetota bacterium]